jgi:hypothetical protein
VVNGGFNIRYIRQNYTDSLPVRQTKDKKAPAKPVLSY